MSTTTTGPVAGRSPGPAALRPATPLPGWPVTAALAGYPIWWALGLGQVMVVPLATVMLVLMVLQRRVAVVPGVLPLLAFCVWVVPCALMLDSMLRLVGYGIRAGHLFSMAVILLYVVGARERYTLRHAVLGMTFLWTGVVVGGYLGMVWPDVRVPTLPGQLLPGHLAQDEFVRDLFFPPLAEVQEPWGAPHPFNRPAAPFPYSNNWGGAIALLTPAALAGLVVARSTAVRVGIASLMVASAVPIGASSNRGMYLALAAALGYVVCRLAARGNLAPFLALATAGGVGLLYFLYGGPAREIATRQQYSKSTEGRGTLYVETFQRTLDSPLLGYGAPRPSYTVEVSVGTQGWLWALMFSYGFVGVALFLYFLAGVVLRSRHAPGTVRLLLHGSLVGVCVMVPYYGLHVAQLVVIAVVAGVLLRDRAAALAGGTVRT